MGQQKPSVTPGRVLDPPHRSQEAVIPAQGDMPPDRYKRRYEEACPLTCLANALNECVAKFQIFPSEHPGTHQLPEEIRFVLKAFFLHHETRGPPDTRL